MSHVGMKIHLHIDSHGNRSALRTHLGYLKESYDTALFWHAKAMSLELLSAENKKTGRKWKKQLDRKYEQYFDAAKAYFDTTKRKRTNSVPETVTQPIQLSNPIVMPRGWQRKKSREKITKITKGQKVQGKISQWAKKIKIKINWGYPKKTCPWSSFT